MLSTAALQEIGLSPSEIDELLKLEERGEYARQIEILRGKRYCVLDCVHENELCIHRIDYIICEISKKMNDGTEVLK